MEIYESFIALCLLLCTTSIVCEDVIVTTPTGEIRGTFSSVEFNGKPYKVKSFLGIPYAKSTAGRARFAKPVKKERFSELFHANQTGPSCPQNINWAPGLENLTMSEDCLSLNVFAPATVSARDLKAVMIFIYGGGFQFGFQDSYIATALTALHDIIYVTMNYRVGVYGFLANKKNGLKGNYGLWDQHMAIKWVHDNILAFGGDPGNVTLFGESAGAVAAMYQALYIGNKGLVHRVIAQSGAVGTDFGFSRYPDIAFEEISRRSNCDAKSIEDTMTCLRFRTVDEFEDFISFEDIYSPVQDGEFIDYDPEIGFKNMSKSSPDSLSNYYDIDVIVGINSDEGLLELNTLMTMLEDNDSSFTNGVSEEVLDKYINKFLMNINKTRDIRIKKSIKHQYNDWKALINDNSRRTMLLTVLKDFFYTVPAIQALNAHLNIKNHGSTFMYYFDHKPSYSGSPSWIKGADHAEELPFVFGFPSIFMYIYGIYSEDPAQKMPNEEVNLSIAMMKYWSQFAKTGNPNNPEDPSVEHWPEYSKTTQKYLTLRTDGNTVRNGYHFLDAFNYWTEIFPDLVQTVETAETNEERARDCYTGSAGHYSNWTALQLFALFMINTCMF